MAEVPEPVREQFEESVSFVVVLDYFRQQDHGELPAVNEMSMKHQEVMNRLMEAYPSLEPTTEGFNAATIVIDQLDEKDIFESHPELKGFLQTMEEWFEQREEPIRLQPDLRENE